MLTRVHDNSFELCLVAIDHFESSRLSRCSALSAEHLEEFWPLPDKVGWKIPDVINCLGQ